MDYSAHIRLIDDMIATVTDALERKGMLDDTVIIFTADHGEMLGDYGRIYKENFLYGSVSIPLLISGKGIGRGICDDRPCMLLDAGATILDIAGVSPEGCGEGISVLSSRRRELVFSEFRDECMVSDGRWKLVVNGRGEPYMLFDEDSDPYEAVNLAGSGREEEQRLLAEIGRHKEACNGKA